MRCCDFSMNTNLHPVPVKFTCADKFEGNFHKCVNLMYLNITKKQNLKCKRNTSEKHYELIFIYYLLIQFQLSASPPAKFCFCLLDVHVHIINILIGNYGTKRDAVKKKTGYLMTLCKIHLIPTYPT